MHSFRLVPASEGPRREFKITLGLRAGYGSAGRIYRLEEAIRTAHGWMRERAARGAPFLSGMVTRGEVLYADSGGDAPSHREPVAIFSGAAYALARWMTRNDADAADVVQEAFLRAFRYFDSYRGDDARSWMLKIVRRACYSWLERNRPADVISLEAEEELSGAVATSTIDAAVLLESRSDLRLLDQLIEALPAPLREMIVLRELHELGYREIAEVTGVPIGTVMSRLHRARSLLLRAHSQTGGTAIASAPLPWVGS